MMSRHGCTAAAGDLKARDRGEAEFVKEELAWLEDGRLARDLLHVADVAHLAR